MLSVFGPFMYHLMPLENGLSPWEKTLHIDGSVQERHNSSASAMELRLSCTKPARYNISSHCPRPFGYDLRELTELDAGDILMDNSNKTDPLSPHGLIGVKYNVYN